MHAADILAGVHGVRVAPAGRDHQAFHVDLGMRGVGVLVTTDPSAPPGLDGRPVTRLPARSRTCPRSTRLQSQRVHVSRAPE